MTSFSLWTTPNTAGLGSSPGCLGGEASTERYTAIRLACNRTMCMKTAPHMLTNTIYVHVNSFKNMGKDPGYCPSMSEC